MHEYFARNYPDDMMDYRTEDCGAAALEPSRTQW